MVSRFVIYEPMTAFTDLLLAALATYLAWEMGSWYQLRLMNVHWHLSRAFYLLALGAFLGAVSHGVGPYFPPALQSIIWKLTILSIGITAFFLVMMALHHVFPFRTVRWLGWIPFLFLVAYLFLVLNDDRFIVAVRFYVPCMVLVLALMIYSQWYTQAQGTGLVVLGIVISFLAAGIQASGFALHRNFNHNDLYHVVQMIGIYVLYRGGMLLTDYGV